MPNNLSTTLLPNFYPVLGYFASFFCRLLIFFIIHFFEKFFQEYNQSVSFDPDQARRLVQTICKDHQQTTQVGKDHELTCNIPFSIRVEKLCGS